MMIKAINSNGVTISVSAGSPTAYLPIGNVTAIRGTGEGAGVVSITNVEDTTTRKLMDLPDEGKVSLDLNYDPDNATHIVLRDARRNRTRLEFQIQLTDTVNTLPTFAGYVLAFALDASVSQQVRGSLIIEVTGATTDDYAGFHAVGDATFDPAKKASQVDLSNGNLTATCNGAASLNTALGTAYETTGKHYFELTVHTLATYAIAGIATASASVATGDRLGFDAYGIGYLSTARIDNGSIGPAYGTAWAEGDVISVLFDADADTLSFWRNGVDLGASPYTPAPGGSYAGAISVHGSSSVTANFGGSAWVYTPPVGYTGWTV